MISPRAALLCVGLGAMFAAASGCAGGGSSGALVVATAVPSGGAAPTPGPCGTPIANGLYVAMASYITATPDPTYGVINGYSLISADGTSYSNVAQPITVHTGDTVQFVNVEPGPGPSQSPIQHSAVSLQGSTFPVAPIATAAPTATASSTASASPSAVPTVFPATAQDAIGSMISTQLWSTGRVDATASDSSTLCYSQAFSTPVQGTYAFGDYDYYTTTNMRDVIIVSDTSTRSVHRIPQRATLHAVPAPVFSTKF